MCVRCIGATFFTSLLLGAALGVTVISVRSFAEDHAKRKVLLAQKQERDATKVSFYFEDAPLREVTSFISNATKRSIRAEHNVNMRLPVTFISRRTMSKEDAFKSFIRLLDEHDLTASIQGSSVLIQREKPLPVRFNSGKGYKTSAPVAPLSVLVGSVYSNPRGNQNLFMEARIQLIFKDRMEGAVVEVKDVGCLAEKITFKTIAIGSIWSKLGLRAGDSLQMMRNIPPFGRHTESVEIERHGETVQLQYITENERVTVIEQ